MTTRNDLAIRPLATSEITWMAVHADHRDRGVGRALMGG
jgi:ribosomal protein S18 acetylase RimI-like enzyme